MLSPKESLNERHVLFLEVLISRHCATHRRWWHPPPERRCHLGWWNSAKDDDPFPALESAGTKIEYPDSIPQVHRYRMVRCRRIGRRLRKYLLASEPGCGRRCDETTSECKTRPGCE